MTQRATAWSVTINNPTTSDEEDINRARQKSGWSVLGQKEMGEGGTPHYQLMVKTPQVRFSALKKSFPRGHIEVARNSAALEEYVQKEETKIGDLYASNEMYPSLSKFWELFYDYYKTQYGENPITITKHEEERLVHLDNFVETYIGLGYHIETMGVNPQIRSATKKYIASIFLRVQKEKVHRQSDRQTDNGLNINSEVNSITTEDADVRTW